jgi:hypothetical protein
MQDMHTELAAWKLVMEARGLAIEMKLSRVVERLGNQPEFNTIWRFGKPELKDIRLTADLFSEVVSDGFGVNRLADSHRNTPIRENDVV